MLPKPKIKEPFCADSVYTQMIYGRPSMLKEFTLAHKTHLVEARNLVRYAKIDQIHPNCSIEMKISQF